MGFGSTLLGGLGSLLGGKSDAEKRSEKVFGMAQNRMGQNVLDPEQYMADYYRAMAPQFGRSAQRAETRLGLDSGAATSDLMYNMQAPLAQFMLNAKMENDKLKSQNDNMLMQIMASLGGR
jgi:hypothetical protein